MRYPNTANKIKHKTRNTARLLHSIGEDLLDATRGPEVTFNGISDAIGDAIVDVESMLERLNKLELDMDTILARRSN